MRENLFSHFRAVAADAVGVKICNYKIVLKVKNFTIVSLIRFNTQETNNMATKVSTNNPITFHAEKSQCILAKILMKAACVQTIPTC